MTTLYVRGPCGVYVNTGAGPAYLGMCEESPEVEIISEWEPVRSSEGGKVPFDLCFQGEYAKISLELSRYNEIVYAGLASRPRLFGEVRGTNTLGDIGTLMLTEGWAVTMWFKFAFGIFGQAPKPAFIEQGMPPGYRFFATVPIGPENLGAMGTKPSKLHLVFIGLRIFDPVLQTFSLYDNDVSEVQPLALS